MKRGYVCLFCMFCLVLLGILSSCNATQSSPAIDGKDGNGIVSIQKTDSEGLVDTYTIYYTNGESTSFTVTNGQDRDNVGSTVGVCALLASSTPNAMPSFSTKAKTFSLPLDTLIIDSRLPKGWVSITQSCASVSWDLVTSAICVYYDIANQKLVACAYNEVLDSLSYILICVIRNNGTNNYVTCSLPVQIDGKVIGESDHQTGSGCSSKAHHVISVNHRGYNRQAPENTLAAYKLSAEKGFVYVECDVSFTKDGIAVLLHDDTVDRTSDGNGKISELMYDEVRKLDFGSWFSDEYTGETIPTFDEFILLCRNLGLHPYIELKTGCTRESAEKLVETVKRYGMQGKVTWISSSVNYLSYIKECDPKARLGNVVSNLNDEVIMRTLSLKTDENDVFIDALYTSVNEDNVLLCVHASIPLEVWTVNGEQEILGLDPYISGVTSDTVMAGNVLYENTMK